MNIIRRFRIYVNTVDLKKCAWQSGHFRASWSGYIKLLCRRSPNGRCFGSSLSLLQLVRNILCILRSGPYIIFIVNQLTLPGLGESLSYKE